MDNTRYYYSTILSYHPAQLFVGVKSRNESFDIY